MSTKKHIKQSTGKLTLMAHPTHKDAIELFRKAYKVDDDRESKAAFDSMIFASQALLESRKSFHFADFRALVQFANINYQECRKFFDAFVTELTRNKKLEKRDTCYMEDSLYVVV